MTHPAVEYLTRCAALRRRGLSLALVHDLQNAGNWATLAAIEAMTDDQLAVLTRLHQTRETSAQRLGEFAAQMAYDAPARRRWPEVDWLWVALVVATAITVAALIWWVWAVTQ